MEGPFLKQRKSTFSKREIATMTGILAIIGTISAYILTESTPSITHSQLDLEFSEFESFILKYNKVYRDDLEYNKRFQIFRDNLSFIRTENSLGHNWSLAQNQFSDLTFEEFGAIYKQSYTFKETNYTELSIEPFPEKIDWVSSSAVTSVKNEGFCGSSWAFSAVGSVEGALKIDGHLLISLSEEELIDCSISEGNLGCKGGEINQAFEYIAKEGISDENRYPYEGKEEICKIQEENEFKVRIEDYAHLIPENKEQLLEAVSKQPISIAVEANEWVWEFYSKGVVDKDCGSNLDHSVLIVGYDLTSSSPYWLVKNSWGTSWGEDGYIEIGVSTGKGNCGMNMRPFYPIIESVTKIVWDQSDQIP